MWFTVLIMIDIKHKKNPDSKVLEALLYTNTSTIASTRTLFFIHVTLMGSAWFIKSSQELRMSISASHVIMHAMYIVPQYCTGMFFISPRTQIYEEIFKNYVV